MKILHPSLAKKWVKHIVLLMLIAAVLVTVSGCVKSNTPLTPARSIAGTWKGLVSDTVYYLTNCNSNSVYVYTTFQSTFTFIITAITDNTVSVAVYGNTTSYANDNCGESPPPAGGFPITYNGSVSSTALTLLDNIYGMNTSGVIAFGNYDVGDFTFTTNLMTGKMYWLQYYSSYDAIGWKTGQVSLTKQ